MAVVSRTTDMTGQRISKTFIYSQVIDAEKCLNSLKINELNQSSQAGVIFFQFNSC